MTVFVVQVIDMDLDDVPVRVFSTREKADEWIKALGDFSCEITECLIDEGGEL